MPKPTRPAGGGLRSRLEAASMPVLRRLGGLPPAVPFVVLVALILGGSLLGGPVGILAVCLAAIFVAWLLYLSWPHLSTVERLMRVAVLTLVLVVPVTQLIPR